MQFMDFSLNYKRLKEKIDNSVLEVLASGRYILGPIVQEFEQKLAQYTGVKHVIACANGTDALQIPLMAKNIGNGDAVFCPSFTFASTAEVVALVGATPVFIDIDSKSYNMDPVSLKQAIEHVKKEGKLKPKAIISVDLFGLPADYSEIKKVADENNLVLIEDAAQSIGGKSGNNMCGSFGDIGSTSFYPTKPLGCYGDGGAIFTNDDAIEEVIRSIAFHGKGSSQYDNVRIGMNSRLDTIQAAILLQKLSVLEDEMEKRSQIAKFYTDNLSSVVQTPILPTGLRSANAIYSIQTPRRDELKQHLADHSIPSMIYYAKGLHQQTAYQKYERAPQGLPVTEKVCTQILSLPMHPYLTKQEQEQVVAAVLSFFK